MLCEFSTCVERASIDEAYIDVTQVIESKMRSNCEIVQAKDLPSTWVVGFDVTTEDVPPSSENFWFGHFFSFFYAHSLNLIYKG